jgi:hypothetical protein
MVVQIALSLQLRDYPGERLRQRGKKYSIAQLLTPAENNWLRSMTDSDLDRSTGSQNYKMQKTSILSDRGLL